MEILENKNNLLIFEKGEFTYLISYKTPIAKVSNTIETNTKKQNNYGLYLTKDWDYSQTTLKQLYNFIELYTTQRDKTGNMIAYQLNKQSNKKAYIQKLIEDNMIFLIKEEEM